MAFILTSSAFSHKGEIPETYTCEGSNVSPPLAWQNIPENTKSLVLIVDDPDAPDPKAPKMTFVHWVLYNISPAIKSFPQNAAAMHLPQGTCEGLNNWNKTGYGGPCPPIGRHRYFHKLYALDVVLPELVAPTKAELEKAMNGHIIAKVELLGTYEKRKK